MKNKYDNGLFKYLIQQCKNPSGMIGSKMTDIWNHTFRNMTHWGLQEIMISNSDIILDVGCGGGMTVNELVNFISGNGKVYGIDISEVAVEKTKRKNKIHIAQNKAKVLQTPIEKLPFFNEMFDKIFAIQTHIYWSNLEDGLSEVFRVLKPHGSFYIICENDKIVYHLQKYDNTSAMIELLKRVGFTNVGYIVNENWIKYTCNK